MLAIMVNKLEKGGWKTKYVVRGGAGVTQVNKEIVPGGQKEGHVSFHFTQYGRRLVQLLAIAHLPLVSGLWTLRQSLLLQLQLQLHLHLHLRKKNKLLVLLLLKPLVICTSMLSDEKTKGRRTPRPMQAGSPPAPPACLRPGRTQEART